MVQEPRDGTCPAHKKDLADRPPAPVKTQPFSEDALDQYIQENFIDEYGVAVRYKFVDRYVDQNKRVTPPKLEVIEPMLEFLTEFWIEPFTDVANGTRFCKAHVPAEVILIGSTMYNADGTVTLGPADAGAASPPSRVAAARAAPTMPAPSSDPSACACMRE